MTTLVRLRIALADQPGALAQVATLIADHGGNITGVDVHRGGDRAVDDLTVEFLGAAPIDQLRSDLASGGAGTLLSQQTAQQKDPVVVVLQRAGEMAGLHDGPTPGALVEALVAAAAEVCGAPVAWAGHADDADVHPAGVLAVERAGAVTVRADGLPGGRGESLPGEAWLLAVPDPGGDASGRLVYVARGSGEFTSTEIARIEALMALANQLEGRRGGGGATGTGTDTGTAHLGGASVPRFPRA